MFLDEHSDRGRGQHGGSGRNGGRNGGRNDSPDGRGRGRGNGGRNSDLATFLRGRKKYQQGNKYKDPKPYKPTPKPYKPTQKPYKPTQKPYKPTQKPYKPSKNDGYKGNKGNNNYNNNNNNYGDDAGNIRLCNGQKLQDKGQLTYNCKKTRGQMSNNGFSKVCRGKLFLFEDRKSPFNLSSMWQKQEAKR